MILLVTVFQISSYKYLCDPFNDVIHVSAQGSNDTIHYIYSSNGPPSVLIARTDTASMLKFNCSQFHNPDPRSESHSVSFSNQPDAVMVLVFSQVC